MPLQDDIDAAIADARRAIDRLEALRAMQVMQQATSVPRTLPFPVLTHCASEAGHFTDEPPEAA